MILVHFKKTYRNFGLLELYLLAHYDTDDNLYFLFLISSKARNGNHGKRKSCPNTDCSADTTKISFFQTFSLAWTEESQVSGFIVELEQNLIQLQLPLSICHHNLFYFYPIYGFMNETFVHIASALVFW